MTDVNVANQHGMAAPIDRGNGQFDAMGLAASGFLIDRASVNSFVMPPAPLDPQKSHEHSVRPEKHRIEKDRDDIDEERIRRRAVLGGLLNEYERAA